MDIIYKVISRTSLESLDSRSQQKALRITLRCDEMTKEIDGKPPKFLNEWFLGSLIELFLPASEFNNYEPGTEFVLSEKK